MILCTQNTSITECLNSKGTLKIVFNSCNAYIGKLSRSDRAIRCPAGAQTKVSRHSCTCFSVHSWSPPSTLDENVQRDANFEEAKKNFLSVSRVEVNKRMIITSERKITSWCFHFLFINLFLVN